MRTEYSQEGKKLFCKCQNAGNKNGPCQDSEQEYAYTEENCIQSWDIDFAFLCSYCHCRSDKWLFNLKLTSQWLISSAVGIATEKVKGELQQWEHFYSLYIFFLLCALQGIGPLHPCKIKVSQRMARLVWLDGLTDNLGLSVQRKDNPIPFIRARS